MARKSVGLGPSAANIQNTLGVASYRTGDWKSAITALTQSEELEPDKHLGFNAFFLAMAHWQLRHKDEARAWYDRAVSWMDKHGPKNEELLCFRAEAEELRMKKEPEKNRPGPDFDFGSQSGRWGPYRQASPSPARHRPGARSAPVAMCSSL